MRAPNLSTFTLSTEGTNTVTWGLPMEQQVISICSPASSTLRPITGPSVSFTGTFSGSSCTWPISTATWWHTPFLVITVHSFTPLLVSMLSTQRPTPAGVPRAMLLSKRYFATQRTPLPHIQPSLPSRLNMVILALATSEGPISMTPSPPTPLWRSERLTARDSGEATRFMGSKQFT